MSRFFRGDGSSSESDSDSSSGEEKTNTPTLQQKPTRYDSSSDDDDQPVKRVVQSQQAKLAQEYESLIQKIKAHSKTNEFTAFQGDLDKLDKALQKSVQKGEPIPRAYIKALTLFEDHVAKTVESGVKLNGVNQKALNAFKQKIKKHNLPYQKQISEYREKPDEEAASSAEDSDDKSESESDDDDDSDSDAKPVAKGKVAAKAKAAPAPAAGDSKPKYGASFFKKAGAASDSDDSEEDDMDESESDDDDDGSDSDEGGAGRWMKKTKDKVEVAARRERKTGDQKEKKKDVEKKEEKVVIKEMTGEQVDKKIAELLAVRGKRSTDRTEQIEQLEQLVQFSKNDVQLTNIYMHLVSAFFDATPSVATHMPANLWKGALNVLIKIIGVLKTNPALVLSETENVDLQSEDGEVVVGNLLAYVERLDDEFIKGLQNIDDPHTHEYVQRLQDEQGFLDLMESVQNYYDRRKDPKRAAKAAFRRMEHLYYKSEKEAAALAKSAATKSDAPTTETPATTDAAPPAAEATPAAAPAAEVTPATPAAPVNEIASSSEVSEAVKNHTKLIHDLAVIIYAHGDERHRTCAMLMHIFHHALHDRFYEARDMMLMSHLQESIHNTDIPTQILFNRAMVQLGLCAFRCNLIWEAHSCLSEICGVSRVKELLAQGVTTRFQDKGAEQEKLEKKRQIPFHMHVNLELLECVHLISALLLEVPNMAANPFDAKRKVISRTFRRLVDYFDRQVFTGPPENNRDIVAAASKALAAGNWKTTETLLFSVKVWALMPNAEVVKANIRKRIQEEGLRTYLFNFGSVYDSISLTELATMFELQPNHVHSLVSKMMINEELKGSWDQPTGSIVMHKVEPSKLQYLALQFAEKAAVFVENNERLLDSKTGGYLYNKEGNKPGQGQQGQDRRQDRSQWQEGGGYRRQPYGQYQNKGNYNKDGNNNNNNRSDNRGERGERGERDGKNQYQDRRNRGQHGGQHGGQHHGGHNDGYHHNNRQNKQQQ